MKYLTSQNLTNPKLSCCFLGLVLRLVLGFGLVCTPLGTNIVGSFIWSDPFLFTALAPLHEDLRCAQPPRLKACRAIVVQTGAWKRDACATLFSPSFLEYIKNDYKNSSDTKESYKKTQARALCICDWQCVASHFRPKILRRWSSLCRRSFGCYRRSFCWRQLKDGGWVSCNCTCAV